MVDQLPIIRTLQNAITTARKSNTLLGRGLAAIQSQQLAIVEQDKRYRQARDIYNRLTDYGEYPYFSFADYADEQFDSAELKQWQIFFSSAELKQMVDIFIVFKQLSSQGYGKAYFPLALIYWGGQGISKNIEKKNYYSCMAFDWCCANQALNDPEIAIDLGFMYQNGYGVEQDKEQAVFWYRKAAEQGNAYAKCTLGLMYASGFGIERDDEQALLWIREAIEQGDSFVHHFQGCLDRMYFEGIGVEQDKKGAEQGDARAQFDFGRRCSLLSDYEQAVFWYRKAANQGYAEAQYNLGLKYHYGRGVEQDDEEAMNWYFRAANQGNVEAQNRIGEMYESGSDVVNQDYGEAEYWFRQAAKQGYAIAQANLGWLYEIGNGVDKDTKEAAFWYRQAAEKGNAEAQCMLGALYLDEPDFEHDDNLAMFWFSEAANQGEMFAQFNLGEMYEKGQGVKPSLELAIDWYIKSAQSGHERAQKRLSELKVDWINM